MGANLVTQVLAHWTNLSDRAFRVLVRMAVTALDTPSKGRPAAVYHGGRELLAMSLRGDGGTIRTRYRTVAKAVAELTEAGAIDHLATGWAGQNAVYKLTLDRAHSTGDGEARDDEMGGPSAHPMDVPTGHPMGVRSDTEWMCAEYTPRNQEEPLKERDEEEVVDVPTTSHPPRDDLPPEDPTGVVVEMFPKKSLSRTRRSTAEIEAASARRAAARAEHQARKEAT
jgi:hypothetical protein